MTTKLPIKNDGREALEHSEALWSTAPTTPEREAPPSPPHGGFGGFIQRMSPGGRWGLGLGMAFLSSAAYMTLRAIPFYGWAIGFLAAFALAIVAGVALASWRAGLALVGALAVGALTAGWVTVLLSPPGSIEGASGLSALLILLVFFAALEMIPLTLFIFSGVALGRAQGLTLGGPKVGTAGAETATRWFAGLGSVLAAALLSPGLGNLPGSLGMNSETGSFTDLLPGMLYAIALASTCLLAGWVIRSWWGALASVVVYSAIAIGVASVTGPGGSSLPLTGYALYILLPAVVMSALGMGIGMARARKARS